MAKRQKQLLELNNVLSFNVFLNSVGYEEIVDQSIQFEEEPKKYKDYILIINQEYKISITRFLRIISEFFFISQFEIIFFFLLITFVVFYRPSIDFLFLALDLFGLFLAIITNRGYEGNYASRICTYGGSEIDNCSVLRRLKLKVFGIFDYSKTAAVYFTILYILHFHVFYYSYVTPIVLSLIVLYCIGLLVVYNSLKAQITNKLLCPLCVFILLIVLSQYFYLESKMPAYTSILSRADLIFTIPWILFCAYIAIDKIIIYEHSLNKQRELIDTKDTISKLLFEHRKYIYDSFHRVWPQYDVGY